MDFLRAPAPKKVVPFSTAVGPKAGNGLCRRDWIDALTGTSNPEPLDRKLPRGRILRGRDAFRIIRETGKRQAGRHLVCNYLLGPSETRAAFIVPKRCGPAVVRNRIRRRLKEAYRHCRSSLRIDAAIVWIARRPAATADFRELEKEMHTLIGRAELWK
jgi:ribonuclease P protein component